MDVQQLHYAPLLNQLHQRAVRSVVSQLALRSKSLTHYLESQYFQPPGQEVTACRPGIRKYIRLDACG